MPIAVFVWTPGDAIAFVFWGIFLLGFSAVCFLVAIENIWRKMTGK